MGAVALPSKTACRRSHGCIIWHMATSDEALIGPDEIAFRLDLTPAQLKVTYTALKSMLDDFGREQRDVGSVIREVINKLPDADSIKAIDLGAELKRRRA
jgi:hypothetical protein